MTHQTVSYAATELLDRCPAPVGEPGSACPIESALGVLRKRWAAPVVLELLHGPRGFTELARSMPALSEKVLTDRLAELVRGGVVHRSRRPGWPPRVGYRLTERGRALAPVLHALWTWGSNAPD
ncbi:winged helix-turn-helix transcriptional regulator [Amycolatopsis aidingensis]|uniref:winged helix-turn-helix transcriptional regulator n=1 Tax=Amycolatopsis aidingensis TaxID=2842453 RepID=UPI001C0D0475|nr:helix-turn-helix domain-containing protein [Amycolatopsis aidingensis]